jgi:hypothetical protein
MEQELDFLDEALTAISGIGRNPALNVKQDLAKRLKHSVMSNDARFALAELSQGALNDAEMGNFVKGRKFSEVFPYISVRIAPGAANSLMNVMDNKQVQTVGEKSFDKQSFSEPTVISGLRVQYASLEVPSGTPTDEDKSPANKKYSHLNGDLPAALGNSLLSITKNGVSVYERQLKDFFTPAKAVPTELRPEDGFLAFSQKFFAPTDTINIVISSPSIGTVPTTHYHFLNFTFKGGGFLQVAK